jgi:rod shape-determining protein MreD
MSNRFRAFFFLALLAGQIAVSRHYPSLRFSVDLLYLMIFCIAIKAGFVQSMVSASLIGLVSDYLSGGIIGVFSFSRTLAAYFLNMLARFIDLRNNFFLFLLLWISLFLSNLVACGFFVIVFKYKVAASLLLHQPLVTAGIGTVIFGFKKIKSLLNVS